MGAAPSLHALELQLQSLRDVTPTIIASLVLGLLLTGFLGSYILILLVAHYPRLETPPEKTYQTVLTDNSISEPLPLPNTFDDDEKDLDTAAIYVSVIVPAFNEQERLPEMLAEAVEFLQNEYGPGSKNVIHAPNGNSFSMISRKPQSLGWEILVVDDGSTDKTAETALKWAQEKHALGDLKSDQLRVCTLTKNRGKGGAVTHGMRHIRGKYAIFADADGASKFSDLKNLLSELKEVENDGFGVSVGSRAHMVTTDAVVKRSFVRNFLMHSFHTLLRTFGIRHIRDTQCGFKLFSRKAVKDIFPYMHTEGWIFDIEILLLASYKNIPVVEVPVSWHEVAGTKMVLVRDSIQMAWDLSVVRQGYWWGVYRVGSGGPAR
ncbi:dolichyl-phosphate beta-glucosyltransferase [Rhizina undulata]